MNKAACESLLGLKPPYDKDDIVKAYRQKAKLYHPDMGGTDKQFRDITEAKEFLLKYCPTTKQSSGQYWNTYSDPTQNMYQWVRLKEIENKINTLIKRRSAQETFFDNRIKGFQNCVEENRKIMDQKEESLKSIPLVFFMISISKVVEILLKYMVGLEFGIIFDIFLIVWFFWTLITWIVLNQNKSSAKLKIEYLLKFISATKKDKDEDLDAIDAELSRLRYEWDKIYANLNGGK